VLARPLHSESCPEDWLRAVEDCAADPSIVVSVGAPATGKSTLARRLLNRYLTGQGKSARSLPAVCYLDLDPIKPEYTAPGQISLIVVRSLNFGPNFTHLATPPSSTRSEASETVRAHCIPTSLVNYRDYYRACIEDLFLGYKSLHSQDPLLPLIVNTPGSLYASDFDLLTELLARIKPHHTVNLGDVHAVDTEQAAKLHSLQTIVSQYRGTVYVITAQSPPSAPMRTDAELRAMHMQSYFHLNRNKISESTTTTSWSSSPVSELVPWEFCYEETNERLQDFVGFAIYSEPTEPASLLPSLNGSVVQIIESTSSAIPTPYVSLSRTKRHQLPYFDASARTGMVEPLDSRTSKLICTAVVRGFDLERRVVQVLVPRTHEPLLYNLSPERTVMVGGCCDRPEWAYLDEVSCGDRLTSREGPSPSVAGSIPWVAERTQMDDMGYLNTVRRVRKFQT
jgi:polynucleotide 5'-hydroxyl-kinase GRC3/NOL9